MHLFVNALAASAGGGLTYVRNILPAVAQRQDVQVTVLLSSELRGEFPALQNVSFVEPAGSFSPAGRFLEEQKLLPSLIRRCGADVLLSAGNFALRNSPVPQILLSRNSLYTSLDFYRDLRSRREYGMWLDTWLKGILARRSIAWADRTVAPSRSFAKELKRWTGVDITAIYHGFDHDLFFQDGAPLSKQVQSKLDQTQDALRLLFVSNYTYYRNFATLIRALPVIKAGIAPRKVALLLTCEFRRGGSYRTDREASLVRELGVDAEVVQLGAVPYGSLNHLYRACDVYVSPAYAETFAHPLVEAMASGLPIVASDLEVHCEICGSAALYFPRFSAAGLAQAVLQVISSTAVSRQLAEEGIRRCQFFSWKKHVDEILALAHNLSNASTDLQADEPIMTSFEH